MIPFLYLGCAPLFLAFSWATLPSCLHTGFNPLNVGLESLNALTSLSYLSLSGQFLGETINLLFGSLCLLLLWSLCAYHCVHPTTDFAMEEWYLNTSFQFSPDFWKLHYVLCMAFFVFLLGLGLGAWWDFLVEVSDAYSDYAQSHLYDDLGPAFDRTKIL